MTDHNHNQGAVQDELHSASLIHGGERIDDLQLKGLKILQKRASFRFGTDAVLLADFAAPKSKDKVVDLGTGTGVLCLLMAGHVDGAQFDAVEIQEDMADMARRSVEINGLQNRIRVHHMDMREAPKALGCGKTSLVVCNPPYSPAGTSLVSDSAGERISRHAEDIDIEDICRAGAALLKNGGRFALVYPAPRMLQLMTALRACHMEPKRVRIVMDKPGAVPKIVLVDAVKLGGEMLHWLPPLILKDEHGEYTDEWRRIYRQERGEDPC